MAEAHPPTPTVPNSKALAQSTPAKAPELSMSDHRQPTSASSRQPHKAHAAGRLPAIAVEHPAKRHYQTRSADRLITNKMRCQVPSVRMQGNDSPPQAAKHPSTVPN